VSDVNTVYTEISVNGTPEKIVFERELCSSGPEGNAFRYFCRNCQGDSKKSRVFATDPFLESGPAAQLAEAVILILAQMRVHADRHVKLASASTPVAEDQVQRIA
jgi:hypothetical protein